MPDLSRQQLERAFAEESGAELRRAALGLRSLVDLMMRMAKEGHSVLTAAMGPQRVSVPAWSHWPPDDARDARTGYRWYYHCHARGGRTLGEHGHFHLFSDPPEGDGVTHLVAVSVDPRGLPLGLFAPNRWVTDERWQPAPRVLHLIETFAMNAPRALRQVHVWLSAVLRACAPQVRALLRHRDERMDALRARARGDVMEDRRIAILSRCAIDLPSQAAALDSRLA